MSSDAVGSRYNVPLAAVLIGVPVLVGASCYYLYASKSRSSSQDSAKEQSKQKQLTPLEQVMQIKLLGNQNYARKNYETAIEQYTSAIEQNESLDLGLKPDDLAIFFQNRAACNEALGDYEKVIEDCDRAIELNKSYTKAYLRRAKAYEKLKNYEKAIIDGYATILLEKFQNQANIQFTDNIVRENSFAKAAEAMKTHKPSWPSNQIIKTYFLAFQNDPIKKKLGVKSVSDAEMLQPLFAEASKPENDDDPESLVIRGTCLSLMGDQTGAAAAFDRVLAFSDEVASPSLKSNALIKKSSLLLAGIATNSSLDKNLPQVLELLDQACKLDPQNPDCLFHKAQTFTLADRYEDAIKELEKTLEIDKDFQPVLAQKLYTEYKMETRHTASINQAKKLLKKLEQSVADNPDSYDMNQVYIQILTEIGDIERADQALADLIKSNPTDSALLVTRAMLNTQFNRDPEETTVPLLKKAVEVDPRGIFAYELLASLETQKGKIDEAISYLETALSHASSEIEYIRCYSNLDSARYHKAAAQMLGI